MRKLIPPIAGTILTVAFELSIGKGWFESVPDIVVGFLWFIPALLWIWWLYTHEEVKRRRHAAPMLSLAIFVIGGAAFGAIAGALGWWSLERQHAQMLVPPSPSHAPEIIVAHPPPEKQKEEGAENKAKKQPPEPLLKAEKPDLDIILVNPESFALLFVNKSNVVLREPKYSPGIYNLDRLEPNGTPTILPIPVFTGDWIRAKDSLGPQALISQAALAPLVKDGDHLFGFIVIAYPECVRNKSFWVFAIQGKGGWYYELPEGEGIHLGQLNALALEVRATGDVALDRIAPPQGRKAIVRLN
jgi:hypothetical protein